MEIGPCRAVAAAACVIKPGARRVAHGGLATNLSAPLRRSTSRASREQQRTALL